MIQCFCGAAQSGSSGQQQVEEQAGAGRGGLSKRGNIVPIIESRSRSRIVDVERVAALLAAEVGSRN